MKRSENVRYAYGKTDPVRKDGLVHLDAAYNLARWLTHDELGAESAMQDACLRAFRFFDNLHGPSPKA